MSAKSLAIFQKEFKTRLGPIIRDTSSTSVSIVLYGTPIECYGFVKVGRLETDEWETQEKFLSSSRDYSKRFTFNNLKPDTVYHYYTFIGSTQNSVEWDSSHFGTFRTDNPKTQKFNFAFGSCRYFLQPSSKWSIGSRMSDRAFQSILNLMKKGRNIRLLLNIGDQVYTDAIRKFPRLRITSAKKLRALHRTARSTDGIRTLMSIIEAKNVADDHEYRDNGNPQLGSDEPEIYQRCIDNINIYDHPNGPFPKGTSLEYGISFQRGPCSFYLINTRFTRTIVDEDHPIPHIMSEEEWERLEEWLRQDESPVKFLISTVPVFFQHYDDCWNGFSEDRFRLVKLLVQLKLPNLFILSGDSHASISGEFNIHKNGEETGARVFELLSSGFLAIFHDIPKMFFNEVTCYGQELIPSLKDKDADPILDRKLVDTEYTLKTNESLKKFRSRVISKDSFATISVDIRRKQLKLENFSRKGKLLQKNRYSLII